MVKRAYRGFGRMILNLISKILAFLTPLMWWLYNKYKEGRNYAGYNRYQNYYPQGCPNCQHDRRRYMPRYQHYTRRRNYRVARTYA